MFVCLKQNSLFSWQFFGPRDAECRTACCNNWLSVLWSLLRGTPSLKARPHSGPGHLQSGDTPLPRWAGTYLPPPPPLFPETCTWLRSLCADWKRTCLWLCGPSRFVTEISNQKMSWWLPGTGFSWQTLQVSSPPICQRCVFFCLFVFFCFVLLLFFLTL